MFLQLTPFTKKLLASIAFHQSNLIAVVGHYDCIANPVNKELHIQQVLKSIEILKENATPRNPEITRPLG